MKCFCSHGWPWFGPCPECRSEQEAIDSWHARQLMDQNPKLIALRRLLQQGYDDIVRRAYEQT